MKEDRERWNRRFSNRPMIQPNTPEFIKERFHQLLPGTVLDVASGDGAVALYLAAKGFTVTATDISNIALERLAFFAQKQGLEVATCLVDLDQPIALTQLGTFDNIVIAHFKPETHHWRLLVSLLRPSGKLLLSTFSLKHHLENNFSRRFCLEDDELVNVSDHLVLEHHAAVNRNGSYMDDYLFRRV
ncbi:MAG: 2-polyprenyl-3-methyl-5-hydroxy-6-metoxy-1,4-benzoquinol methylase [Oleiphilaceae bacterium]